MVQIKGTENIAAELNEWQGENSMRGETIIIGTAPGRDVFLRYIAPVGDGRHIGFTQRKSERVDTSQAVSMIAKAIAKIGIENGHTNEQFTKLLELTARLARDNFSFRNEDRG